MTVGDLKVRTCKECGNEFTYAAKGAGRLPDLCSPACRGIAQDKAVKRYREGEKYREAQRRAWQKARETYNPWLWENTILEWNE
jgi:hypothetical protein